MREQGDADNRAVQCSGTDETDTRARRDAIELGSCAHCAATREPNAATWPERRHSESIICYQTPVWPSRDLRRGVEPADTEIVFAPKAGASHVTSSGTEPHEWREEALVDIQARRLAREPIGRALETCECDCASCGWAATCVSVLCFTKFIYTELWT